MNQEQKKALIFGKKTALITLALLKSFFLAVTQVAWGLVSIFALNAVIYYMYEKQSLDLTTLNHTFLRLETFIGSNIMPFVWVFFVLYAFFEIKEVLK